jgi:FlaA1/EpsC-like NDP-sugar epimerase
MTFTRQANKSLRSICAISNHLGRPRHLPLVSIKPIIKQDTILRTIMTSAMSKRLEGKTILITGASSGIGRSTAFEFARTSPANLKLILAARRLETLEQVKVDIEKEVGSGVKVFPLKLDVGNPEEVRGFVKSLPEEFRDIDVLVNNAYVLAPMYVRKKLTTSTPVVLSRVLQRHQILQRKISTPCGM